MWLTQDPIVLGICLLPVLGKVLDTYVLAIFFDIRGAFDNVWWTCIFRSLKGSVCPKNLYALILDYCRSRSASIVKKHASVRRDLNKGYTLGSILGPKFWNLLFDDCLSALSNRDHCKAIAYADDLVVLYSGNSRRILEAVGTSVTQQFEEWCTSVKIQLSRERTVMMLLKGKLNVRRPPTIHLGGRNI